MINSGIATGTMPAGRRGSLILSLLAHPLAAIAVMAGLLVQPIDDLAFAKSSDIAVSDGSEISTQDTFNRHCPSPNGRCIKANSNRGTVSRRRSRLATRERSSADLDSVSYGGEDLTTDIEHPLVVQMGQALHDGPIQILGVLDMGLARLLNERPPLTACQETTIRSARELLTRAIDELRDISLGSIAPRLHDLNAEQTVRLAVREYETATERSVQCELNQFTFQPSSLMRLCLFRIVQECLNNSFSYAQGGEHIVKATRDEESVCLIIEDSGIGNFSVHSDLSKTGLGLLGLRRQVETLCGTFNIFISPDRSVARAVLPMSKVHDQHTSLPI